MLPTLNAVDINPKTPAEPTAQQLTSNDKNNTKPNKDPGRVAAGKKLAEDSRRVREEKREERRFKTIRKSRP